MSGLLRLKHLEHIGQYEDDGDFVIKVKSKRSSPARQCCLLVNFVKNGRKKGQRFRDEPNRRQTVYLEIDRQRYKCNECGKPMYEGLPDIDEKHDMTKRLRVRIQKDAIEYPFSHAAEINGTDEKQVERIFKAHAERVLANYTPKMPRVLGMDEKYIQKQARFIIGDIEGKTMLDMQMSRRKLDLKRYFTPMPGRSEVEVVCQDMWKDYRSITKDLFKNAVVVIDKYHVQRTSNLGVEFVRRAFQDDASKAERIHLKGKRKVFLARWGEAKPHTINRLNALFAFFPVIRRAYEWKESYYEIYDATSKADANERMSQWLRDLPPDLHRAFKASIDALNNWRPWILNYWDYPYTNAYSESLNNLIGRMNMQGVGYDLDTLRSKALLKHGVFTREMLYPEEAAFTGVAQGRKVSLGVPLSTWEADLRAGTF